MFGPGLNVLRPERSEGRLLARHGPSTTP